MAGTRTEYIRELYIKFAYFRNTNPVSNASRPLVDNISMMKYITKRWDINENITLGASVDSIFMAVSHYQQLSSQTKS